MSAGSITTTVHPLFQAGDGGASPTSALQFSVREISVDTAMSLNAMWHSLLPMTNKGNLLRNRRAVFYGAEFQGAWYAVAIWTSPVAENRLAEGKTALELRRFAIAPEAPKNTASRLLAVMTKCVKQKFPDLTLLLSYQAEAHHHGTIYKASGWTAANKSDYTTWHVGEKRNAPQTTSAKIRWEKRLAPTIEQRVVCELQAVQCGLFSPETDT